MNSVAASDVVVVTFVDVTVVDEVEGTSVVKTWFCVSKTKLNKTH